ncbi:MAG: hypothetical protein LBF89_07055 [Bacteroidales bacterium]|jgi:hypothetical protein|nr:hypothetical protein [Bacteroidales bacterium]
MKRNIQTFNSQNVKNRETTLSAKWCWLALLALTFSCKKDDPGISAEYADELISVTHVGSAVKKKSEGPLYAYSTVNMTLDGDRVSPRPYGSVYFRWTYDSVSVIIDGVREKVTYSLDGNSITVTPNPYYTKTGILTLALHMSIFYSPTPDALPSNVNGWKFLRTETEEVQYQAYAALLPQQALKQPQQSSVTASVYYVPSIGVRMPCGETVYENYKYEFVPSLSLNGASKPLTVEHAGDSLYYFHYAGVLESGRTYAFSATAKWYRRTGETWTACDARFDETVSWTVNATANASVSPLVPDDIEFSYPMDRQFNFLRREYPKGYFRLYSREKMKILDKRSYIRIKDVLYGDVMAAQEEIAYNSERNVLEYVMPNILEPQRVYKTEIVDVATQQPLYAYFFKTGKFDNFTEKWQAIKSCFKKDEKWRHPERIEYFYENAVFEYDYYIHIQKFNIRNPEEVLDSYEADDHSGIMPLVQFETRVDEQWKTTADWMIYGQPSLSFDRKNYGWKRFGFPPVRAIVFEARPVLLADEQCATGDGTVPSNYSCVFSWYVQTMTRWDKYSAHTNAYKIRKEQRTEWQEIAAGNYEGLPWMDLDFIFNDPPDVYPLMDAFYVLPGINIETTVIRNIQLP